MDNPNFIENLAVRLGQNATVKSVFGEPVKAEGKTIIPVAMAAYGFGGGYGKGKKKLPSAETDQNNEPAGEGAGGGGGMAARPLGVYVVDANCTRFVPAFPLKQVFTGIVVGFLLHKIIRRKR